MPDVKGSPDSVLWLPASCFPHCDEFFREVRFQDPGFQQLYLFQFNKDAVKVCHMPVDLLFKVTLRVGPGDDIYVCSLALAESSEVLDLWVCL